MDKLWGVWELDDKIGQGSFGEVYKSHKSELGKTFYAAIKHISLPKSQDEIEDIVREGYASTSSDILSYYKDTIDDLVKEIEIMYELRANKNIVDYQDHLIVEKSGGETGYDIYIRMELLKSLDKYLESKSLDEKEVVKLGLDIANALVVCNKHNLLHRDIKPANIFVDDKGIFKLGDFGVARRLERTTYGMSKKGTYNYMSPEIYKGDVANIASDIYSLGIVMYRLLNNNRAPFVDKNVPVVKASEAEEALVRRMSGEELPDIDGVDKTLMKVIKKACSFYKKDRYSKPEDLLSDLKKIYEDKKDELLDKLDKTVSVYDDPLEKTVSVYDEVLDKTVSVYSSENNKKGNYESDEELRERIRKIMAEEQRKAEQGEPTKFVPFKTYNQKSNKVIVILTLMLCAGLAAFSIFFSVYKNIDTNALYSFHIGTKSVTYRFLVKAIETTTLFLDASVFLYFLVSMISRKAQKIVSYGYLLNVIIYAGLTFLVVLYNYRISPLFFGFMLFHIALFYINYKWKLVEETVDIEEDEIESYEEKNKKLLSCYEKPYMSKLGTSIISVIFLAIIVTSVSINLVPINKQENGYVSGVNQIVIKNPYINIRKEASSRSSKLGEVYQDERYTVLDKIESGKYTWYKIRTSHGVEGYIVDEGGWIMEA